MASHSARRVYSTEQLLALRRSASDEPALTIQKRAEEGAIRDHVLRGSRSSGHRSASSVLPRDFVRMTPEAHSIFPPPVLGEIDPNNQRVRLSAIPSDSPTASLKKKKAEEILKQHGSPPGVRVTAGGRLVPSEQSPLCSPRYGYSAVQKNGGLIKFAPGYPPPPKSFSNYARTLPNGWILQDPSGTLVQVVDGRLLAVQDVNGIPQLYITAPNLDNAAWAKFYEAQEKATPPQAPAAKSDTSSKPDSVKGPSIPSVTNQINALEKQYQKLESERRSLDKTEVLKRSELTSGAYNQLVHKRRELIERQDELRRSIKALKESKSGAGASSATVAPLPDIQSPQFTMPLPYLVHGQMPFEGLGGGVRMPMTMPTGSEQLPFLMPQGFYQPGLPSFMPVASYMPQQPTTTSHQAHTFPDLSQTPFLPFFNPGATRSSENEKDGGHNLQSDSAGPRSVLNPMSPIYEPTASRTNSPEKKYVSPVAQDSESSVVITDQSSQVNKERSNRDSKSTHGSSEASYATADFFPHNPRDHSLRKEAYPAPARKAPFAAHASSNTQQSESEEAIAQPEMERHNPNWNPTIPDQAFQKLSMSAHRSSLKDAGSDASVALQDAFTHDHAAGYDAGLARAAIDDDKKSKDWFDGYCKGLLESVSQSRDGFDQRDADRPMVKLPNTSRMTSPSTKLDTSHPIHALGSFKDLVTSPANENALLSPDPEGPHVDAIQGKSLGAWSKPDIIVHNAPVATTCNANQLSTRGTDSATKSTLDDNIARADFAQTRIEPLELVGSQRAFSSQTRSARDMSGSYFQRAYGAHRVLSSPMDWKSANSVAQVAGLANGYFAQFDGTSSKPSPKGPTTQESHGEKAGSTTKFKEATMTEQDLPSPGKTCSTPSPKKSISPAKAKFAAIAGRAGIKVRTDRLQTKETNDLDQNAARERRPWRNVWKGLTNNSD